MMIVDRIRKSQYQRLVVCRHFRMRCLSQLLWIATVHASFLQQPFSTQGRSRKQYDDQIVLRIPLDSLDNVTALYTTIDALDVDVWSKRDDYIDLRLSRAKSNKFFDGVPGSRNSALRMIPDLEYAVHRSIPTDYARDFLNEAIPSINDTFFSDFQTVEAIDAWMKLVALMHPDIASSINLGTTHEGRPIMGLKISRPSTLLEKFNHKKRKVILVHGAQHAREWISISTVCYLAYSLVAGRSTMPEMAALVDNFDWVFIPTVNVDGYAYTFQDRLWRKNRQPTSLPFCKGIDLDRNWAYGWVQGQNIMSNPCSENYQGASAFEAAETRALSDYIESIHASSTHSLVGYLDLHSYAQTILYPYSLSCDLDVRDEESLIELGVGASRAMKATSGEHYDTESACNQDGHVMANMNSGAALDWVYHNGVPWSYVVKLRDTGSYGFLVPREEIIPTGDEMLEFIKYYAGFIIEHSH